LFRFKKKNNHKTLRKEITDEIIRVLKYKLRLKLKYKRSMGLEVRLMVYKSGLDKNKL